MSKVIITIYTQMAEKILSVFVVCIFLLFCIDMVNTDTAGTMCMPNTVVVYPTDSSVVGMDQPLLLNAIDDEIIDFIPPASHNLGLVSYHENVTIESGYLDMSVGGNDAALSAVLFGSVFSGAANSDWAAALVATNNLINYNPNPDFVILIVSANPTDIVAATNAANALKGNGAQILVVAVGSVTLSNIQAVSGTEEGVDYILTNTFSTLNVDLAAFLPNEICCDGFRDNCGLCNGDSTCDDGDSCTENDICDGTGLCEGTPIVCPVTDADQCTIDECVNGSCQNNAFTGACDDGNACTENDVCTAGSCAGTAVQCDDGIFCDGPEFCVENPNAAGQPMCMTGAFPDCTDNNICTQDVCDFDSDQCDNPPLAEIGQQCGSDVGACTFGIYTCSNATGLVCFGNTGPQPEQCGPDNRGNGIDEDCDGVIDNGCGAPCDFPADCPVDQCSVITCVNNTCVYTAFPNGTLCDDGFGCTSADQCINGTCAGVLDCDDMNECTDDICNPFNGECANLHRISPCDDGDECTLNDACQQINGTSICIGSAKICNDMNQCTADSCDSGTGNCIFTNLTSTDCDDADECTLGDICQNGECVSSAVVDCDDNNICSDDTCLDMGGAAMCTYKHNNLLCDDGNACTSNDTCVRGMCTGLTIVNCADSNVCTLDMCDVTTGCINQPISDTLCDDADLCTTNDVCVNGTCVGTPIVCNDKNPCTVDTCQNNDCIFTPLNGTVCDDGNACTVNDVCVPMNGTSMCMGVPMVCNDTNVCTTDVCIEGVCNYFNNTLPCDDGSVCTQTDQCDDGICKGANLLDCNDLNDCTNDTCDAIMGCVSFNLTAIACDDLDPCTLNDTCINGECIGTPMNCTDDNVCTDDKCFMGQCVRFFNTAPCNDGNPCDNDTCIDGQCVPGPPMDCGDSNVCTLDFCDMFLGCQNVPVDGTPSCDDLDPCTVNDKCVNGTCTGEVFICDDNNPCTADSCDTISGSCLFVPMNFTTPGICSDNDACTINDVCINGCCHGTEMICDDGNNCTTGVCMPGSGAVGTCAFVNNDTALCDDGNLCTDNDTCIQGQCVGTPKICDDGNACTNDTCNMSTGLCETVALDGQDCDDGSLCTLNDTCVATFDSRVAICEGVLTNCDDGNICTVDICSVGKCFHSFMLMDCDDGDPCTVNDTCNPNTRTCVGEPMVCVNMTNCIKTECSNGMCIGAPVVNGAPCDDGNPCTENDQCNANTLLCEGSPVVCDDGLFCNGEESCDMQTGSCVTANIPDCDDGDLCTYDQCNFSANQCVNTPIPCIGDTCGISDVGICQFGATVCNSTTGEFSCDGNIDPEPQEICDNQLDDNCNGVVDEGCGTTCITVDDCDDLLPCSSVQCLANVCVYTNTNNTCDDLDACTMNDVCLNGICTGTAIECDDNNPCTNDFCILDVAGNSTCVYQPNNSAPCDDGDECTLNDHCVNQMCTGTPKNCNDMNACTDDFCNCFTGECFHVNNTNSCDDGNICTLIDRCSGGVCVGFPQVCVDGDQCTTDSCNPTTGACEFVQHSNACDDGDLCTENDFCRNGVCSGIQINCDDGDVCTLDTCNSTDGECVHTPTIAVCDDGNPCTLNDLCNLQTGNCTGIQKNCDDDNHCTTDTCDVGSGMCINTPNNKVCDDGNVCTIQDRCVNNICVGTPMNCDDGNVCTTDSCNILNGMCLNVPNNHTCDDGNPCTSNDLCDINTSMCVGSLKVCDDANDCTDDTCNIQTGNCTHTINNMNSCTDGDLCTVNDTCVNSICQGVQMDCDDSNVCTTDRCITGECVHTFMNGVSCDDGDSCTANDICIGAICVGIDIVCDDLNICTQDFCVDGECQFLPCGNTIPCDDGDLCTENDTCSDGVCIGQPKVCDDLNFCNGLEFCNSTTGACSPGIIPNCTDGNLCTQDLCDNNAGMCVYPPISGNGTQCGATDQGVCEYGEFVCNETTGLLDCIGNIDPIGEICDDQLDNDCDGLVDEGCGQVCDTVDDCPTFICNNVICNATNMCEYTHNTENCDDADLCTRNDQCKDGLCVGIPLNCNDHQICTADSCNATTGLCENVPVLIACDDLDPCTLNDHCVNGTCVGTPFICDDNNQCTLSACSGMNGMPMCFHKPNDNATCEDGNACTLNDRCVDSVCVSDEMICNDSNVCTTDSCISGSCVFTNNTLSCDDGNACTTQDVCQGGVCVGTPIQCTDGDVCTSHICNNSTGQCESVPNVGFACDDLNPCTVNDTCNEMGICAGQTRNCTDNNICTVDTCNNATGVCEHTTDNGQNCNDGDPCTYNDICIDSAMNETICQGTPLLCDDGNNCTDDSCTLGICCHTPNTLPCDDQDICTMNDQCDGIFGMCVGQLIDCNDNNTCTMDECVRPSGTCRHIDVSNIPCDDGDVCTTEDMCISGQCIAISVLDCDDQNVCTTDFCNSTSGACINQFNTVECNDGNMCTQNDTCINGTCVGQAVDCNTFSVCTTGLCNSTTGLCDAVNNNNPCDDGDLCTTNDRCLDAVCVGTPVVCTDNNPCTNDTCNPLTGTCEHVNNMLPCDDQNPCTVADMCIKGVCMGMPNRCSDNNECTDDMCNKMTGECEHTNNDERACRHNDKCIINDRCFNGTCIGDQKNCDDSNICTTAVCNSTTGDCEVTNQNVTCDDQDPCTQNDRCMDGVCSGDPVGCDDGNDCTEDFCFQGKCFNVAITGNCDDGNDCTDETCDNITGRCIITNNDSNSCDDLNPCTLVDRCEAGVCIGDSFLDCADSNPCTQDICNVVNGTCSNVLVPDGTACDDGDGCTVNDVCLAGVCSGSARDCDDGNICTGNTCDPQIGDCITTNNTVSCDDGDLCTFNDACLNGRCQGTPVVCDQSTQCMNHTCMSNTGTCSFNIIIGKCDDGDLCTENDLCINGECVGVPKICIRDQCNTGVCDPTTGNCTAINNGESCDDNDACTLDNVCMDGVCVSDSVFDCDDNNICTHDLCFGDAMETAMCYRKPNTLSCDDGNLCTVNDTCDGVKGICIGQEMDCADDNLCTDDFCSYSTGLCVQNFNHLPCDDGNPCTLNDTCAYGRCNGVPKNCDDNNDCTTDSCVVGVCRNVMKADNTLCVDNQNKCLEAATCLAGECVGGSEKNCTDNNPCTNDTCNPETGECDNVDDVVYCDDANVCTTNDVCVNGTCIGDSVSCDDGNPCTNDICDSNSGCINIPVSNGTFCDDGQGCTINDYCINATCVAGQEKNCTDGNICTDNTCDYQTGDCTAINNNQSCDDANLCTVNDTCVDGVCIGSEKNCDDSNDCTIDTCEYGVCKHEAVTVGNSCIPFEEQDACLTNYQCNHYQQCVGTPVICTNTNQCSHSMCNSTTGECEDYNIEGDCDDADPCTENDRCEEGVCVSDPIECDNQNPCSKGQCSNGACYYTDMNNIPCNDYNMCTSQDTCVYGICRGTVSVRCSDDDDQCQEITCNPATGVCEEMAVLDRACDDRNKCTTNDKCNEYQQCVGTSIHCDDYNECTNDYCNTYGSCVYDKLDKTKCTINNKPGLCDNGKCKPQNTHHVSIMLALCIIAAILFLLIVLGTIIVCIKHKSIQPKPCYIPIPKEESPFVLKKKDTDENKKTCQKTIETSHNLRWRN